MGRFVNTILLALCNTVDYFSEYLLTLLTENPVPPALLATLVFAQHARPFQPLPMLFPPLLLFSTYLNLQGFKIDSAGTTAALSGAYLVLAGRRRMGFVNKFGARGIIRGATMGLCLVNLVGGGLAYSFGSRTKEDDKRKSL
jgi:MFS superfamily sulfate permease-like transporter